jgi:hypothetical protein
VLHHPPRPDREPGAARRSFRQPLLAMAAVLVAFALVGTLLLALDACQLTRAPVAATRPPAAETPAPAATPAPGGGTRAAVLRT